MLQKQSNPPITRRLRHGALFDLIIVMAVLVAVKQILIPVSLLYAGPASTFSAMIVATWLLKRRGIGWRELGFRWPESWPKTLALTLLTLVAFFACVAVFKTIADHFFTDVGTSGRFDHIKGNLAVYLIVMVLVWTHSAIFEELLFRAFIITKTSLLFGAGRNADVMAVVLAAIFFGYRHYYYQGLHGAVVTGGIGVTFGLLYIWFGRRNILPLILAHGSINSLLQTFRYLGVD